MKLYKRSELTDKAKAHFVAYPGEKTVWITENGYAFRSANRAKLHASEKNLKVYSFDDDGSAGVENETTTEPDLLDGNVAKVIAAIPFLTRAAAEAYLSAEGSGKNRVTVVRALTEFLASIPESIAIDPASPGTIPTEGTVQLSVVPTPGELPVPEVTWESSDPAVATVDETGLVTGVTEDTVDITATTKKGFVIDTVSITVNNG